MYEYLYDMQKALDFVHREGTDKSLDWISRSIPLRDLGITDIEKLTVSELFGIIDDLESLCDEDIDLHLTNIEDCQCITLTLKNPEHYNDDEVYDRLLIDSDIKASMNTILDACKNWTNNHKDESLRISYHAVEQLYDLLTELDDIININKVDN